MITPTDLAGAFGRNVSIIRRQTDGLTHADSLLQPPFRGNCLNWIVGHIAVNRDNVLRLLGEQPVMDADGVRYRRESDPIVDGADEGILPLDELLDRLARSQEQLSAALGRVDQATLARELTFNDNTTTVKERVFTLYFHDCYHTGQTELLRQLAGKNDQVIK
jgi:hypothetical protein